MTNADKQSGGEGGQPSRPSLVIPQQRRHSELIASAVNMLKQKGTAKIESSSSKDPMLSSNANSLRPSGSSIPLHGKTEVALVTSNIPSNGQRFRTFLSGERKNPPGNVSANVKSLESSLRGIEKLHINSNTDDIGNARFQH